MRILPALLLLSLPLAAQGARGPQGSLTPYLPGHDKDLYHQEKEQAAKQGSATVDIVGTLSKEEIRQIRFQEFMAWFIPDLHRFLGRYGDVAVARPASIQQTDSPARTYPVGAPVDF